MNHRPNILLVLPDGMQARTVEPESACQTPHLDALARRGIRFSRAHTTCPTCSPARASLMTGLLPHNHGVLEVEHGRDADQCVLREDKPHWAQRLAAAGYQTGYFGKWHIERTHRLEQFGWKTYHLQGAEHVQNMGRGDTGPAQVELDPALCRYIEGPRGYNRILHYGVTDTPVDVRYPGLTTQRALEYLAEVADRPDPWCCAVSYAEPNEALVVSRAVYESYDTEHLPLPPNLHDDFSDRPGLYRRQQQIGAHTTDAQWRQALACYYGRITEVDGEFGKLMSFLEQSGQLEDTLVLFVADHGRYVGSHGFDAHNFGPFEEIYGIPLIVAGPGVAAGEVSNALVSIADICPTLLDVTDAEPIDVPDSRSFAEVFADPVGKSPRFDCGYAEYHGTRFPLMQRIVWRGKWKFVFNGFDFDELYDLQADAYETTNLASWAEVRPLVEDLMAEVWRRVRDTGDRAILESHYYSMRFATVGPNATPAAN